MELGLVFLGTGAALAARHRGLPSIALVYRGSIVLLDCGEGTQHTLARAGLSPLKVEAVLITHLHGDHVLGLPGLLQTMAMQGRRRPLLVAGPPGLKELIEAASKLTHWLPSYPIYIAEPAPWQTLHLPSGLEAKTFPADHTVPALGYRIQEPRRKPRINLEKARKLGLQPGPQLARLQRDEPVRIGTKIIYPEDVVEEKPRASITYTGDTRPSQATIKAAKHTTILIHDSTFTSEYAREAHEKGHSTAKDAATIAKQAGAQLLILTHISARYRTTRPLLDEARRIFPRTIAAEDLAKLPIRP
ncbi:hypothetical protein CF15_01665 [Pyrodictium occultum]|uniref:Ribonuclease Z n=1 Tax=Pyrodictium occultum TaxID=2309 RepID=A0A0V8RUA8_PYROC|nr:ribonuclease Z [Pyrodictium occultum]KSW11570.1 hypothetical protein CF15_01665 [Pyrodictium occultum]